MHRVSVFHSAVGIVVFCCVKLLLLEFACNKTGLVMFILCTIISTLHYIHVLSIDSDERIIVLHLKQIISDLLACSKFMMSRVLMCLYAIRNQAPDEHWLNWHCLMIDQQQEEASCVTNL